jgi:ribosome-binding ATPase
MRGTHARSGAGPCRGPPAAVGFGDNRPAMQIAIVGLTASGKTTVFNTLTRGHAQTGGFGGLQLNVGVVKVPDERLDRLAEIFHPKKIVHADVTYADLPAPPASSEGHIGTEELPAEHLARLRDSDALLHVVRAFDDPAVPHPEGSVDAWRDLERLDLEFVLADLAITERRLERLGTSGRHGTPAEREANEREEAILVRLGEALSAGRPIRDVHLEPDEEKAIRGFRFLTEKPVLVLLNLSEAELPRAAERIAEIAGRYDHRRAPADALSARIEMELGELDPDEAAAFMEELGVAESSLDRVIALSYRLLGLVSFLTAGPDEVRAWPIPAESTAVDAAAAIHTDLARGFIRAEVVAYDDLLALGSTAEARKHGRLRSEGKTYRVQDGDVLEVLFSR